jgi:hypothetical protein
LALGFDERRLRTLQKHLNTVKLLIVHKLGYVQDQGLAPNYRLQLTS